MTVKELKDAMKNIPENAKVIIHIASCSDNESRYEKADDLLWSPVTNTVEVYSDGCWED